MGGTEIFDPLSFIYESMEVLDGFSRNIFLITDGDVSNVDQVLELIQNNRHNGVLYTLGIGSGVSKRLIEEGAARGNGKCEFVSDISETQNKAKILVSSSQRKFINNFWFDYNKDHIANLVPDPNSLKYLRDNEPLEIFILLKPGVNNANITLKSGETTIKQLSIDVTNPNL